MKASLFRTIGRGQYKKQKYEICDIWYDDHIMMCWYVVAYNSTMRNCEKRREIINDIFGKAIDIRTLPNYKDAETEKCKRHPSEIAVPIIKEAVRKGYIKPC